MKLKALIYNLVDLCCVITFLSLCTYAIYYKFNNPHLTQTQLFLDLWKNSVIVFICACRIFYSLDSRRYIS
jgi:uncharacterized membrane protein